MPKAQDVMNRNLVYLTKHASMVEAAKLLMVNDITGIPIVDEDMRLVGIITEKDILDLYHIMQYPCDRTVNSSMSHEVVSFDVNDDLDDICTCLRNEYFRRVPITREGRLAGVISRHDLIVYLLRSKRRNEEAWV